jgi:hypothetical protein
MQHESQAKEMVEEMKKDPAKMKELEQAMQLMKDPSFQAKVCFMCSMRGMIIFVCLHMLHVSRMGMCQHTKSKKLLTVCELLVTDKIRSAKIRQLEHVGHVEFT